MRYLAPLIAAIALAAPASATRADSFYWSSDQASVTLDDSDWAATHAITAASCYGRGPTQTDVLGDPTFATFRCALRNRAYAVVAHVTLTTTGPETFALSNLVGRLKHCH